MKAADVMLLALDPGEHAGYARWRRTGECGLLQLDYCGVGLPPNAARAHVVLVERPEIWKTSIASSIITLAMNAGRRVRDAELMNPGAPLYGVLPKTWKKEVSKEACHAELEYQLADTAIYGGSLGLLQTVSSRIGKKKDDLWDAVALGLWGIKRYDFIKSATDYVFPTLK